MRILLSILLFLHFSPLQSLMGQVESSLAKIGGDDNSKYTNIGNIAILQIDNLIGVTQDSGDIRSDQSLSFTHA